MSNEPERNMVNSDLAELAFSAHLASKPPPFSELTIRVFHSLFKAQAQSLLYRAKPLKPEDFELDFDLKANFFRSAAKGAEGCELTALFLPEDGLLCLNFLYEKETRLVSSEVLLPHKPTSLSDFSESIARILRQEVFGKLGAEKKKTPLEQISRPRFVDIRGRVNFVHPANFSLRPV